MSDTRREATPGWGPNHLHWPARFRDMSPKMQERDRNFGPKSRGPGRRLSRFRKGGKNSKFNLLQKIDDQREKEAHT